MYSTDVLQRLIGSQLRSAVFVLSGAVMIVAFVLIFELSVGNVSPL